MDGRQEIIALQVCRRARDHRELDRKRQQVDGPRRRRREQGRSGRRTADKVRACRLLQRGTANR